MNVSESVLYCTNRHPHPADAGTLQEEHIYWWPPSIRNLFPPSFLFLFKKKKKDVSVGSGNWVDKYLISELILASWLSYVVLIGWDTGGGRSAMVEGILPVLGVRAALCLCRCSDIVLAIGMLLRRMRSTQGWGSAPRRSDFAGEYDMGRKM